MRAFVLVILWGIGIWIASLLFQYCLWVVAAKDAPWYLDILGGLVCNGFILPAAVVCWILQMCGVPTPFIH